MLLRNMSAIPTQHKETYSISDLAREFDVTPRAIRFYEDQGLLAPQRSGSRRIYGKRDYVRLKLTLRGKRLGLSLSEVGAMFDLYDSARDEKPQLTKFLASLAERREQLERQRADIDEMLGEIAVFEAQCRRILAASPKSGGKAGKRAG
jgi:DNA-binding transcriptional MerR regulator